MFNKHWHISLLLLAFASFSELALAQFSVQHLQISSNDSNLQIITKLNLVFTEPLTQAVDHGVTLELVTEFGIPRERWYGRQIESLKELRYFLSRSALSGRYVIYQQDRDETRTFPSLTKALEHISIPPILLVPTTDVLNADDLAVRTYVDTYKLPSPLRLQAFFSQRWSLDSGWTLWPIQL